MRYSVERLCADVMARLGEIARPHGLSSACAVPWPEDIIHAKCLSLLPGEGASLIREAPVALLGAGLACGDIIMRKMPSGMYAAEVRIPEGFLRMVSARMGEWRGSVRTLILPESAEWARQWSAQPGIAGCPERPCAYLDSDGEGRLVRLVGSVGAGDALEWMGVWCVPVGDEEGGFDFPGALYAELVGRIAWKTLSQE